MADGDVGAGQMSMITTEFLTEFKRCEFSRK